MIDMDGLRFNQKKATVEEVKTELRNSGHLVPDDASWERSEVSTGLGVYDTKAQVLSYWLIGCSDEFGGR